MRILLSIIQTLADYYYIFGYYISGYYIFGWEVATENVITENVIIYSDLASVLNNEVQTVVVILVYD